MSLIPRASASRFAGSTVTTSTLPPTYAAATAATEAAVVVFPTPPGPHAITTSRVLSKFSTESNLVRAAIIRVPLRDVLRLDSLF